MTVKRYDSRIGNSMGLSVPCSEMYANPTGGFVTYSDYQKLVAENAALKSSQGEIYDYTQQFTSSDDHEMWNAMHDIYKLSSTLETPATDAAIAEIKAQGVDMAVERIYHTTDDQVSHDVYLDIKLIAANLRAGRKG